MHTDSWRSAKNTYTMIKKSMTVHSCTVAGIFQEYGRECHTCETWLIHVCTYATSNITHVRHDSFMCAHMWLIDTNIIRVRRDSFMWDMTHSCETWLIHAKRDSFICAHQWLRFGARTPVCDMTLSYAWILHIWDANMTHIRVSPTRAHHEPCYIFALK